jgi:hypothetical protein
MLTPEKRKPPASGQAGTGAKASIFSAASSIAPIDLLLPRLAGVRQVEPGVWSASCPTSLHLRGDKSRGLRIRERDDHALLLWCGAGCGAADIVDAVGLDLSSLFPPRNPDPDYHGERPKVPPLPWRSIFEALELDLTAASLAFSDLAAGKPFSPADAAYIAQRAGDLADQLRRMRHGR